MAEAIVNHRLGSTWQAFSAGTKPAGYTHPKAIKVLAEMGIEHNGLSKHVDEFHQQVFDVVITVCDSASEECPVWLGPGIRHHISFPDPAEAEGTEEEILEVFRSVREDISKQIINFLETK
jgi:arsenate reductase